MLVMGRADDCAGFVQRTRTELCVTRSAMTPVTWPGWCDTVMTGERA